MRRPAGLLCVIPWAILLIGIAAHADEESARYFLQRAMTELDKKRFDKAEDFLDKSFAEKKDYPPAHVGYAQLDRERGRRKSAIAHLEACLAQKSRKDLSADEKEAMNRLVIVMTYDQLREQARHILSVFSEAGDRTYSPQSNLTNKRMESNG